MEALPVEYRQELSAQSTWLYRTLRSAELAGLDPGEVARSAIDTRDLAGARDVAAVIDARIRSRVYPLLPQPQGRWADGVPELPDSERQAYLAGVAAMMDGRKQHLGQHAVETMPAWAVKALGPIPTDPDRRQEWKSKAASIGAYREMYGYRHPTDPIGPEPSHDSPDQRAAWHEAFQALGPTDGPDVRAMPDGRLWLIRDTYTAETQWAPQHVGKELRIVRLGAANAEMDAIRSQAEADAARKAGDRDRAGRHEGWADAYRAMRDHYQAQEQIFTKAMSDRCEWERATEQTRHLAVAADAELRRRHPDQAIEPLRSAEPEPASDTQREELNLAADEKIGELAHWVSDLAARRQEFAEKMAERQALRVPSEDPEEQDVGRPSPPGTRQNGTPSSSRPSRRSLSRRRYWSLPGNSRLAGRLLTNRRALTHDGGSEKVAADDHDRDSRPAAACDHHQPRDRHRVHERRPAGLWHQRPGSAGVAVGAHRQRPNPHRAGEVGARTAQSQHAARRE